MRKLKVLDCTLRDGGYCNQWKFEKQNIYKIISNLLESGVDIIECGFLTNRIEYDENISKFTKVEQVSAFLPVDRNGCTFVVMMNYGEYSLEDLPYHTSKMIDGIRVAFHKKNLIPALEICEGIKEKGYKVFIQAMVSLNYTDDEFLDLIHRVNEIEPDAFYIVDSFGVMKRKEIIRLFYMVEHNLKNEIAIGFHGHNNMQLSYSNAQALVDIRTDKNLVIDSSILGMGRGAGNLNTELFVEYLNDNIEADYKIKPLLNTIDEVIAKFRREYYWGYSLPNYLSAKHNTHPNYARFFDAKNSLTVENMDEIFTIMDDDKRVSYDKEYAEQLYIKYMETGEVQETRLDELTRRIAGKEVLIIGPGKSSVEEKSKIISYAEKTEVVSISINYDYPEYDTDFIFISNLRRYRELDKAKLGKCIVTSNIPKVDAYLQTKYADLLNKNEAVKDNAGMMLCKFLTNLGAAKIMLAGLDGYSMDESQNYANDKMALFTQRGMLKSMNDGMEEVLNSIAKLVDIEFLTTPKFINL